MLCCYKFARNSYRFFIILFNITKNLYEFLADFSTQIIRSEILNRLLGLHSWDGDADLFHVFAVSVFVGSHALFFAFEKEDLGEAFVGVDARWEWGCVRNF